jgi:hypothetical protein
MPMFAVLSFVVAMLAIGLANGYWICRRFADGRCSHSPLERLLISAGIGLGLSQYLFFVLGLLGLLTPRAIAALLLAWAVMGGFGAAAMGRDLQALGRSAGAHWQSLPRALRFAAAVALALLVLRFLHAVCPPIDHDGLYYHLTGLKRWFAAGRFVFLPTLTSTNMPFGWDALMGMGLAIEGEGAAKSMHFLAGLLTIGAAFALARRAAGPTLASWVALIVVVLLQSSMERAYVDVAHAFYATVAVLAFDVHREWLFGSDAALPRRVAVVALLAGLTATVKILGVMVLVALAVVVFVAARDAGLTVRASARRVVLLLAIGALPLLPWLAKNAWLSGNPLYPIVWRWLPAPDWYPELGREAEAYHRLRQWARGHDWSDATRAWIVYGSVALVLAATALRAVWLPARSTARYVTLSAGLLLAAALWTTGLYMRLMMFAFPLLSTAAALALRDLALGLSARAERRGSPSLSLRPLGVVASAACCAALLLPELGAAARDRLPHALRYALGAETREAYLRHFIPDYDVWAVVNALPASAAVLSTSELTYFADRFVYVAAPTVQGRFRFRSYEEFEADLQRSGITHVLAPAPGEKPASSAGPRSEPPTRLGRNCEAFVQRLLAARGTLVYHNPALSLFAIAPTTAGARPRGGAPIEISSRSVPAR